MMFWAKEAELINLEPMSEAQRLLGYTTGSLAHRILYSSAEKEGGFHSFSSSAVHQHGNTRVKWR